MFLKQRTAAFILLAGIFTPLAQLRAQECVIDLSDSIISLTQAQADAAGGNTSSALSAIADVQAQLEAIQQACSTDLASVELSETYTEPNGIVSFQYPAGWFEDEFHLGRDWQTLLSSANLLNLQIPRGGTITVTSEETALTYSPFVALEGVQSVTVLVGSPLHLLSELGLYSDEFEQEFLAGDFGFDEMVETLQLRIQQSPMTPDLLLTQIEAEHPTVGIEAHGDVTSITLVLAALDEAGNGYALLVSPTLADEHADMLPLLEAMAATVD
ncbi:MAG: hypothetical protein ABI835_07555 [Chloroflexota bacterium]